MTDTDPRRLAALTELRTWIRTPFRHQGRTKGKGADCIGIALAAARCVGAVTPEQESEIGNYGRLPYQDSMRKFLERHMLPAPPGELAPLDIALISLKGRPMHVAVLSDWQGQYPPFGLIHAMADLGMVTEQRFDPKAWSIRAFYRFPELG